ncbi:restriction endonuclease [Salipiger sp. P9]|uniref:restriction endonuclease n=1 Tax=Salipiger pentaromativorans TaxID=2943193 RepID=UPI00215845A3|nr:restriction endonuclease [Salipiger pentaromativorans]MCR8546190.1 restriction endonuclease [Salipiger pentaromativorans]
MHGNRHSQNGRSDVPKLDKKHLSQLYRYFSVTHAKFAILTNGQVFQFYSDLEEPNKLDNRPFFSIDLLDYSTSNANELKKFEKSSFDVDRILATAERLKYTSSIKQFIAVEMEAPSEDLVRLIASHVHEGRITASVKETVSSATKAAFTEIIRDAVRSRLSTALDQNAEEETQDSTLTNDDTESDIETTQDEVEGMLTVRAIVRDVIAASRVGLRDAKSYCAILVDDNNRKPLARLHFNRKQWYLGLFDSEREERVAISSLADIYDHADRIRTTASRYISD